EGPAVQSALRHSFSLPRFPRPTAARRVGNLFGLAMRKSRAVAAAHGGPGRTIQHARRERLGAAMEGFFSSLKMERRAREDYGARKLISHCHEIIEKGKTCT